MRDLRVFMGDMVVIPCTHNKKCNCRAASHRNIIKVLLPTLQCVFSRDEVSFQRAIGTAQRQQYAADPNSWEIRTVTRITSARCVIKRCHIPTIIPLDVRNHRKRLPHIRAECHHDLQYCQSNGIPLKSPRTMVTSAAGAF
jgi:hypothetical protein